MIERAHGTLKNILRCLSINLSDWEKALPSALLAMWTAINNRGISPALVVYGEQISVPSNLFFQQNTYNEQSDFEFVEQLQSDLDLLRQYILQTDPTLMPGNPEVVSREFPYDHVYLRNEVKKTSLSAKYSGPYAVLRQRFPVVYIYKDGKEVGVNVDRLKPCYKLQELAPIDTSVSTPAFLGTGGPGPIVRQPRRVARLPAPIETPMPSLGSVASEDANFLPFVNLTPISRSASTANSRSSVETTPETPSTDASGSGLRSLPSGLSVVYPPRMRLSQSPIRPPSFNQSPTIPIAPGPALQNPQLDESLPRTPLVHPMSTRSTTSTQAERVTPASQDNAVIRTGSGRVVQPVRRFA